MTIPTRQIDNNNKSSEEKILDFVEEQISKYKKYTDLANPSGMPGFYELNEALMNFSNYNFSLIALDVIAKTEYQQAKDALDDWMAEKYMIARATLNPSTLSATKWASSKEIEYYIRTTWYDEYKRLNDNVNNLERKVAFLRRMLDAWSSQLMVLNRLSRNTEVEAMRLSGPISE